MASNEFIDQQLIRRFRRRYQIDNDILNLGDGSGNTTDGTGKYYVRRKEAEGRLSEPFALELQRNANLPERDGLSVVVGLDDFGEEVIKGAYLKALRANGENPIILNPFSDIVYGSNNASTLTPFIYGRNGNTTTKPFYMWVLVSIVIIPGEVVLPTLLEQDLLSLQPASGEKLYAVVVWNTDNTLSAYASTAVPDNDPLTGDDLYTALSQSRVDSIPIVAWELRGTDTLLSSDPAKSVDLRQFVNSNPERIFTVTTTDATVTTLASIAIAELQMATITAVINGVKSDYSAAIGGTLNAVVRRATGGNVTLVGSATTDIHEDSSGTPTFTLDVDTGTQTARFRVTGISAETWVWTVNYKVAFS